MDPKKHVSKYLINDDTPLRPERNDNTRPPGKPIPIPGALPDLSDENLHIQSLTPVRVLEKIRQDIINVLGFHGSIAGKFTNLEQKLINYLERIVRKGQCPSILVQEQDLIEAMLALRAFHDSASVSLKAEDGSGVAVKMPVFESLYKYAKDAGHCDQQIRELRLAKSRLSDPDEKNRLEKEAIVSRERKDHCLMYFQRIVFTDSESLSVGNQKRNLALFGKGVTLDDLIAFLKKGGRLDQARGTAPAGSTIPAPTPVLEETVVAASVPDEDLGTFERSDASDEIVDWRRIKSGNNAPKDDDQNATYSFNL